MTQVQNSGDFLSEGAASAIRIRDKCSSAHTLVSSEEIIIRGVVIVFVGLLVATDIAPSDRVAGLLASLAIDGRSSAWVVALGHLDADITF